MQQEAIDWIETTKANLLGECENLKTKLAQATEKEQNEAPNKKGCLDKQNHKISSNKLFSPTSLFLARSK